MGRPVLLKWKEDKADGEVETVKTEGASIDDANDDGGEDKQE